MLLVTILGIAILVTTIVVFATSEGEDSDYIIDD